MWTNLMLFFVIMLTILKCSPLLRICIRIATIFMWSVWLFLQYDLVLCAQQCRQSYLYRVPNLQTHSFIHNLPNNTENRKTFSTSPAISYAEDSESTELVEQYNTEVSHGNVGRLFAVIHTEDGQRKITTDDIVILRRHTEADIGERIVFNKVLLVGGADFTLLGKPVLSPEVVRVEGTVIEKTMDATKVIFYYIKRKNHKYHKMKKDFLTMVRINSIQVRPVKE